MPHGRFAAWRFDDWKPYPPLPEDVLAHAVCQYAPVQWFFPAKGMPPIGKKLCAQCGVRDQCLDFAINNNVHFGLWGGLTERERYAERRRRRQRQDRTGSS